MRNGLIRTTLAILIGLSSASFAQVSEDARSYSIWFNDSENRSVLTLGPENDEPAVIALDCLGGKVKGLYNRYYGGGSTLRLQKDRRIVDIGGRATRIMGQNLVEFYPSNSQLAFILSESPRLSISGRTIVDAMPKPDEFATNWISFCKLPVRVAEQVPKKPAPLSSQANACVGRQHASVPTGIYGKDYHVARDMLIKSGWQPRVHNGTTLDDGIAKSVWSHGFREVTACAGTGSAPCEFEFSDIYGSKLQVITQGEFDAKRSNSIGVYKYQLACDR